MAYVRVIAVSLLDAAPVLATSVAHERGDWVRPRQRTAADATRPLSTVMDRAWGGLSKLNCRNVDTCESRPDARPRSNVAVHDGQAISGALER
jgi:hypothetical protein